MRKSSLDGIFLGKISDVEDLQHLRDLNIKSVLCAAAGTEKSLAHLHENGSFNCLVLPLLDDLSDNILIHLPSAFDFIRKSLEHGNLLICCVAGVSRSRAIEAAYLMFLGKQRFSEIACRIPDAKISENFIVQLEDFAEKFEFDMSRNSVVHRIFWSEMRRAKRITLNGNNVNLTMPVEEIASFTYHCRICGDFLFEEKNVFSFEDERNCAILAIENIPWLNGTEEETGKINCRKCKAKLGHWNWHGLQCTCKKWITPAFFIAKNKIDKKTLLEELL